MRSTKKQLQVVPWGSWKEWDCVRAALFSGCDSRISAAIERITAWQARAQVPVSIEITANILSIQQRDSYFREDVAGEAMLPEEMLRLMYAMAIMRLINGVVDDKKNFARGSVAFRALKAELPHLLVDIRHDSAHGELPGIALLRMASEQALQWLEVFYWQQQKASLDGARKNLKLKVVECSMLLQRTYVSSQNFHQYDNKHYNQVKHDRRVALDKLVRASLPAPQDLVSIFVDDTLLESSTSGKTPGQENDEAEQKLSSVEDLAWKYLLSKLTVVMPQLLQMLVLGVVRRLVGLEAVADAAGHTFMHEGGDSSCKAVTPCNGEAASRLVDWLEWLLVHSKQTETVFSPSKKAEQTSLEMQLDAKNNRLKGQVSVELNKELLALSLNAEKLDKTVQEKLVKVVAADLGSIDKASRLAQLRKLPTTENVEGPSKVPELNRLESNMSEMTRTQQSILNGNVQGELISQQETPHSTGYRKRWTVAQNWQPCAIGMLPSCCYFGGARPPWLLDCVPELCYEGASATPTERKRKRPTCADENEIAAVVGSGNKVVKVSAGGHKEMASSSSADVRVAKDRDSTTPKEDTADTVVDAVTAGAGNSTEIDYHEKTVKSIKGCLLLNGRFQPVGPELFTALQRDIRVL